eukprot:TRINITY_DN9095_c0_g1_i1.p1 TRINITY_DN9095_c0_g1~~TRINITY_DN9095_c0_g1_i1.p1  ORF type:complete len:175 (+),score=9.83 TRINITY_DN9095_c0_g1_i1:104-628(+)
MQVPSILQENSTVVIASSIAFGVGFALASLWQRRPQPEMKTPEHLSDDDSDDEDDLQDYKMVLIVREDLKMTTGKIGAQVGHAVLGAYKRGVKRFPRATRQWELGGQAKIALRVPTEQELLDLQKKAESLSLNTYIVMDAGRTQVASGSRTVLAVGPGPKDVVDKVTGQLRLLP